MVSPEGKKKAYSEKIICKAMKIMASRRRFRYDPEFGRNVPFCTYKDLEITYDTRFQTKSNYLLKIKHKGSVVFVAEGYLPKGTTPRKGEWMNFFEVTFVRKTEWMNTLEKGCYPWGWYP